MSKPLPSRPVVRDRFNTIRYPQDLSGPVLTQQGFQDECDINKLMERYKAGAPLPAQTGQPLFGDFSEVGTFQEAHELLVEARERFMELPSELRARFRNDPGALQDWLLDPANREEASRLGLTAENATTGQPGAFPGPSGAPLNPPASPVTPKAPHDPTGKTP